AGRGCLRAVYAITEFGHVDVDLEDAGLRPHQFDQGRIPGLKPLAHPAAATPEEQVLRRLLADRACAPHLPAAFVVPAGLAYGLDVEAVVPGEFLVFGGDHGQGEMR